MMKKKIIMMSAVALLTANALTFGPVSFKVVDKAYASPVVTGQATAAEINKVLSVVKATPVLKSYVKEAATVADKYLANTTLSSLDTLFHSIDATGNEALQGLIDYIVDDLRSHIADGGRNINDLGTIEAQLANIGITKQDAKALAASIVDYAVGQIDIQNITGLLNKNLVEFVLESFSGYVSQEWSTSQNSAVLYVKNLYEGDQATFVTDVKDAISSINGEITDADKKALKYGTLALGMGLIKSELAANVAQTTTVESGKYVVKGLDVLGKKTPAALLSWTLNGSAKAVVNGQIVSDTSTFTLVATLPTSLSGATSIPAELLELKLFDRSYRSGGGSSNNESVSTGELQLVTNAFAIASAIDAKVTSFLSGDINLTINKGYFALKALVENELRAALTVPAASKVKTADGVSTLDLTVADLEYIFTEQLNYVLTQATKAFEDATGSKNLNTVMTFDLGASVDHANAKLSAQVISTLEAKGIKTVGIKAGGAVVEVPLSSLVGASSVVVKKSDVNVDGLPVGAKQLSSVYTVQVLDAAGKEISAFPAQYSLAITPDTAPTVPNSATIAKVTDTTVTFRTTVPSLVFSGQFKALLSGFSEYVVVENKVSFNDTSALAWAEADIELAASNGIILGKADGIFDPRANVTRAEFTAMIVRALGIESTIHTASFSDVNEAAWYHSVVASAVANGIINGRTSTTFDPDAHITREEMATITANALKAGFGYSVAKTAEGLEGFADAANVAEAHKAGVALVAQEGVVQGKGNGAFDPKGKATRAEAAVIIAKTIKLR